MTRRAVASVVGGVIVLTIAAIGFMVRGRITERRALGPVADGDSITMVVHPFRTLGDSGGGWFGVGLASDVERALTKSVGATIRPWAIHGSSGASRDTLAPNDSATLRDVGRRLGVTFVLGGSLRRNGSRTEIALSLVRSADGVSVWSATYWRDAIALNDFAAELAEDISSALRHAPPRAVRQ